MDNYKQKYYEIKQKYIELKNNYFTIINGKNMSGGAFSVSHYNMDNKLYRVCKTEDHQSFSFREIPFNKIDKDKLTSNIKKPDKNKILYIDDVDTFDWFTFKYGKYDKLHMFIEWDKVFNDYGGFYLNTKNKDLYLHRYAKARKGSQGKFRATSWWSHEYENLTYYVMVVN